ncbi:6-O-methylguanine DNA methyltransferase, partial [Paraphysoderma sedebokerense]
VPKGKLTTYKAISDYLSSAPRAVGQALKNNPFAPFIPCHRVVANNGYVGGFSGQWGSGCKIQSKKAKLKKEGVLVGDDGFVKGWDIVFWNQFK